MATKPSKQFPTATNDVPETAQIRKFLITHNIDCPKTKRLRQPTGVQTLHAWNLQHSTVVRVTHFVVKICQNVSNLHIED